MSYKTKNERGGNNTSTSEDALMIETFLEENCIIIMFC